MELQKPATKNSFKSKRKGDHTFHVAVFVNRKTHSSFFFLSQKGRTVPQDHLSSIICITHLASPSQKAFLGPELLQKYLGRIIAIIIQQLQHEKQIKY